MFFSHRQELYLFTYNDERIALTSSNRDLTFDNIIYKAERFISRTQIANNSAENKSPETQITVSKDNPVADWFRESSPYRSVELQIISVNTDDLNDFRYIWSGTILQCNFKENKVVFDCFSKDQILDRNLMRMTYQNTCNYTVYQEGCNLDINNFSFLTTITSIGADGITFEVASNNGRADGWFINGTMRFGVQQIKIQNHVGTTITTLQMFTGISVGDQVQISWGCDRYMTTCKDKFNNLENNLSFLVPSRNPFKGEITD